MLQHVPVLQVVERSKENEDPDFVLENEEPDAASESEIDSEIDDEPDEMIEHINNDSFMNIEFIVTNILSILLDKLFTCMNLRRRKKIPKKNQIHKRKLFETTLTERNS